MPEVRAVRARCSAPVDPQHDPKHGAPRADPLHWVPLRPVPARPMLAPLLALLIQLGCTPAPPPAPLSPPHEAVERLSATLGEAIRLDAEGQRQEAITTWARATEDFSSSVTPWLNEAHGRQRSAELAYELALIHQQISDRKGQPQVPCDRLTLALAEHLQDSPATADAAPD